MADEGMDGKKKSSANKKTPPRGADGKFKKRGKGTMGKPGSTPAKGKKPMQERLMEGGGKVLAGTVGYVIAHKAGDAIKPEDPNATDFSGWLNVAMGTLTAIYAPNPYVQALGVGIGVEGAARLIRKHVDPNLAAPMFNSSRSDSAQNVRKLAAVKFTVYKLPEDDVPTPTPEQSRNWETPLSMPTEPVVMKRIETGMDRVTDIVPANMRVLEAEEIPKPQIKFRVVR